MRFWDSSALLPLISDEETTDSIERLFSLDDKVAAWWGTWVECAVAISRFARYGDFTENEQETLRAALDELASYWTEVEPVDDMRLLASLVSKDHPLKSADALQLAAALRWCEGEAREAGFVCLDNRLRAAALGEGFTVLPSDLADAG